MILSVFVRMLYEIANNVYQKRNRESNEIQQNEVTLSMYKIIQII